MAAIHEMQRKRRLRRLPALGAEPLYRRCGRAPCRTLRAGAVPRTGISKAALPPAPPLAPPLLSRPVRKKPAVGLLAAGQGDCADS